MSSRRAARSRRARAVCPYCWREMAVYTPKGGDGSADRYPNHTVDGKRTSAECDGWARIVPLDAYVSDGFGGPS